MALTKIKADGLTADLIDETKLADNSIDSEHYNDGSIDNAHLADDAVGVAELSATGTASSSTFLRGDNSWTTVNTDLVSDTSPQLGGNLDVNTNNISFGDSSDGSSDDVLKFGAGDDLTIFHNGSASYIKDTGTGNLVISSSLLQITNAGVSENMAKFTEDGAVELYHDNVKCLETRSDGGIEATDGNFIVGTAGHGVQFDTADSGSDQLLDDFEEGTYIPTMTGATSTTDATLYSDEQKLSYHKIGSLVTVHGRIRLNGADYAGQLRLSLPFTANSGDNTSNSGCSAVCTYTVNFENDAVGSGHNMGLFLETGQGSALAYFLINRDNVAWIAATSSHIGSGDYLCIQHTYKAA